MLPLFGNLRRHRLPRRASRKFRVESLESRNCPSAVGLELSAHTGSGQNVDVSVQVMQMMGPPQTYNVALSGAVTGNVAVGTSGFASYVGTATTLGTITGTLSDSNGDTGQASCEITDVAPVISELTVTATGPGKQVQVSGNVTSQSPAGLAVTFSGSAGLTDTATTTDANGHFSLVTTAANLGNVSAVVTDVWGVASTPVTTTLTVQAPQISGLTAVNIGNGYFEIQGTVNGPDTADDTVNLSGLASGSGSPSNGSFSIVVYLGSSNPNGTEYAVATDVWGQTSNQAQYSFPV